MRSAPPSPPGAGREGAGPPRLCRPAKARGRQRHDLPLPPPTGVRFPDAPANPAFLERVLLLNQLLQQDPAGGRTTARVFPSGRNVQSSKAPDPLQPSPTPLAVVPHPMPAGDAGAGGRGPEDQPVGGPKPKLPDGCFKRLFDRFKKSTEYTDLAQTTKDEYARHMRHLEPVLGFHQVSALTADLMDQLIGKFSKHPTLQKAIRRTMSALLSYAVRILKWIPRRPWSAPHMKA
jgi:hypothetical protein